MTAHLGAAASASDPHLVAGVAQGDEQAVYADRGYDGWWYRQELAMRGIGDGMFRPDHSQCRRALGQRRHSENPPGAAGAENRLGAGIAYPRGRRTPRRRLLP